jgi:hypothetical protein
MKEGRSKGRDKSKARTGGLPIRAFILWATQPFSASTGRVPLS